MTRNVFIALLALTIVAVLIGDWIAKRYADPGIMRTLIVAGFTAAVVFPAAKIAEKLGWIKGEFKFGRRHDVAPPPASNKNSREDEK